MIPIVVGMVASAVISGVMQWMNSEEAANATAEERQRMVDLVNKMQDPQFDFSDITPEEYKVVETYVPEQAKVIDQVAPQTIKGNSAAAQQSRSAQMDVLSDLMNLAQDGNDPITQLANARAEQNALSAANSQNQTLDMQMARRGLSGSGLEYAGKLMSNQAAARDVALQQQQAAADAAQRRMGAMGQAGNLAGSIYGQELGQEEKNAQIINDFNRALSQNRQNVEMENWNARNAAAQQKSKTAQDIANQNTSLRNTTQQYNKEQGNKLAQQKFDNQAKKVGLQTGQYQGVINDIANRAAQNNQAISGLNQGVQTGLMYADSDPNKKKQQQGGY